MGSVKAMGSVNIRSPSHAPPSSGDNVNLNYESDNFFYVSGTIPAQAGRHLDSGLRSAPADKSKTAKRAYAFHIFSI